MNEGVNHLLKRFFLPILFVKEKKLIFKNNKMGEPSPVVVETLVKVSAAPQRTVLERALDRVGLSCGVLASMLGGYRARRAGMTPVGALTVAAVCGVGGGTLRDIVLGRRAFWVDRPRALYVSAAAGLFGYYLWDRVKRATGTDENNRAFRAVFGLSLGAASFAGVADARRGFSPRADLMLSSAFTLLSAAGGGALADMLLGRRPAALYPEGWLATMPALAGTGALVADRALGLTRSPAQRVLLGCATALLAENHEAVCRAAHKHAPKGVTAWVQNTSKSLRAFLSKNTQKRKKKARFFW